MSESRRPDSNNAQARQDMEDETLCKEILNVLREDGSQRVLLAGRAGIGKTRLAKKVGEYASIYRDEANNGYCFLTLCLHLNNKFEEEDELSLYENIASQLSVHSDFEETEVDDRDEDEEEEKKPKELLDELKKNIIKEIAKREMVAADIEAKVAAAKPKKEAPENAKKKDESAEKEAKELAEKKAKKERYLLLILDDEGSMTKEDVVMKDLKLERFLIDEILKDHTRLKILITRRKEDEEPTDVATTDTKGSGSQSGEDEVKSDDDSVSEDKITDAVTDTKGSNGSQSGEDEVKNDDDATDTKSNGSQSGEDEDTNDDDSSSEDIKADVATDTKGSSGSRSVEEEVKKDDGSASVDKITEEGSEPPATDKAQVQEVDVKDVPTTDLQETTKPTEMTKALLDSIEKSMDDLFVSTGTAEWIKISDMVEQSKKSPAAVAVLANSLEQITKSSTNPGKEEIEKLIKKVLSAADSDRSDNPLLCLSYELLEIGFPLKDAIQDCFWHSLDFFEHCGCVYYRDLITQWILEGYFDPVRSVEKAYQDGHLILMELINRGMLKIQENNVVVPERAMSTLIDPRRRGLLGRSRLRFSRVYCGDKKKGIGKITQIDDMIKTVQAKKGDKATTVLVSGDRLRRETPEKYFKKLSDLEVLGLFEPTLDPFVSAFSSLVKLRVLVIRDCDLLTDIEELKALKELNALEVSGASSLNKISDEFFKELSKLQSLHLSGLQITTSPSSISELKELHCLIIKDCPLLEDLPDIQELVKLEVVDVSGARGLQTCFDNTKGEKKNKSKNKNFYHLTRLQLLDFSESQIERLPIFQDSAVGDKLHSVKRLLLRDCSKLRRLPSLKPLSGLQILDLSGTTKLVEMLEVCFEDKKELKTLDLSGTNLNELATTIEELSNLSKLLLKDCTNLEVLPNIKKLTKLDVIDVSGCSKLHTIEGSFEDMSYLCEVNLSGTKVKTPELPKETKITCLKHIILADGRRFEGEEWSKIRDEIESKRSDEATSSSEEIREEVQQNKVPASDSTEKRDVIKERLRNVPIEREMYKEILSRFDSASQQEVMKIHESKDLQGEAKFVSFVDIDSTKLKSFFNETKSVKFCSLRMCMDIKDLFVEVDEESLGTLETLSISNFPLLETICWGGNNFKNLKKLSIDCCPKIKTLFPEASQMPSSLAELNINYCEKLEKVVEGVELSSSLKLQVKNCPKLQETDWVMVEPPEISPQE
ncbi:LOW QUALITY PROTEIN: probable disease resistance protein At5g45510 [Brassica rapa]|uniref:LOW QUALITY PROTEIN: probable disease resistance protein At5g45510 n=1 Tax=Brassica campestris TaxID=3711 RepID=UPI00142E3FA0|nr:LOW QUALITY PROTEIN: probable disease resistance protein At5g45510 [Brassica rapa]